MMMARLKKIYGESEQSALLYFSQFCSETQKVILAELYDQKPLEKNLIKYLIGHISNTEVLDCANFLLLKDNLKPKQLEFYKELQLILENKLNFIIQDIKTIGKETKHKIKNIKFAHELVDALNKWTPELNNEDIFYAVFARFRKLDNAHQFEILEYLIIKFAPLSNHNLSQVVFIIDEFVEINDLANLKESDIQDKIELLLTILNKFDEHYPRVKEFTSFSFSKYSIHNLIFCYLISQIKFYFGKLFVEKLKEEKISQAISLLKVLIKKIDKFRFVKTKLSFENSIVLSYMLELINMPFVISTELSEIKISKYFKNLYILFNRSVDLMVKEFLELNYLANKSDRIFSQDTINSWLYGFDIWLSKYIFELKKRSQLNEKQTKKLDMDFKKQIIGKFLHKLKIDYNNSFTT